MDIYPTQMKLSMSTWVYYFPATSIFCTFVSLHVTNMLVFYFFPKLLSCNCWSSLVLLLCSLWSVGGGPCSKSFFLPSYCRGTALISLSDVCYKQPSLLMRSFTNSDFWGAYCFLFTDYLLRHISSKQTCQFFFRLLLWNMWSRQRKETVRLPFAV